MQNEDKIKPCVFEITQKVEDFGISFYCLQFWLAINPLFPLLPEKIKVRRSRNEFISKAVPE